MDSYKDGTEAGGKADGAESGQVKALAAEAADPAGGGGGGSAERGAGTGTEPASGPAEEAVFDSATVSDPHSATRVAPDQPPNPATEPADPDESASPAEPVGPTKPGRGRAPWPRLDAGAASGRQSAAATDGVPVPASGPARSAPTPDSGPADPATETGPGERRPARPEGPGSGGDVSSRGIAGLPFRFQVVAALALAVIGVVACVQIGMVFLHVAPPNTISKQYGKAVDDWIYPEFEQNWKLFAPNPLQQNIDVQARAEIKMPDGSVRTTGWTDFSAQDGAAIRHNPLPSHTEQNELRRAWDFFVGSHTDDNKANGLRGELSEQYLRRILVLRLGTHRDGGTVDRVQVRSMTTSVKNPSWSDEKSDTRPSYREVPWWTVTPADLPSGAGDARTEAKR
ncbi:DUF5819 family protein [Streptomyces sp. SID1034]|uniref:DUF5819 family protein n=1 Tax=Streptomyces sp. SID1034 TaxID=2690248 RepID=UPI00144C717E|nr:DUF5819 family protein [Streptomyces sp. SID1034]MYV94537.1 hypothetical protein [Streptomyces sp. SID1034]